MNKEIENVNNKKDKAFPSNYKTNKGTMQCRKKISWATFTSRMGHEGRHVVIVVKIVADDKKLLIN